MRADRSFLAAWIQRVALASVLLIAAQPAQALVLLKCSMADTPHNWVARAIVLAHQPGASLAIVADEIGLYTTGRPTTARITSDTAARLRFTWTIRNLTDRRGNIVATTIYRATLSRRSSRLTVSANPTGFRSYFTGRGTCKPVPDAERRAFEGLIRELS